MARRPSLRPLRRPLVWSSIIAVGAQLLLAAAAAAVTNGADWPR
jgi:hypothetical protein